MAARVGGVAYDSGCSDELAGPARQGRGDRSSEGDQALWGSVGATHASPRHGCRFQRSHGQPQIRMNSLGVIARTGPIEWGVCGEGGH